MAFVYLHRELDTGNVFYIGIGIAKGCKHRAYRNEGRNNLWTKIFNKHGKAVEILIDNISWQAACFIETSLIQKYGRVCLKTGCLANMTNGGEGANGVIRSEKTKQILREINTGKTGFMKGKKFPQSVRNNMSKARMGKAPWNKGLEHHAIKGGKNPNAKQCINILTKEIVSNATELAKKVNLSRQGLTNMLSGFRRNKTDWAYVNG